MKKSFLITLLGVLVAGSAFAQSTEIRNTSSFSEVSAHEAIDVYLKKGSKEEVKIVSESHDLADVLTEVSGDKLKIHLQGSNQRNVDVSVYVTYVSLESIKATSAASVSADGTIDAKGNSFKVHVSSAADIEAAIDNIDELEVEASSAGDARLTITAVEIEAKASSAANIIISGSADSQDVSASSSADYKGYDLKSKEAYTKASSGGAIRVNVDEKLEGRASSGGSVRYKGDPTYINADASSGGSVKKS